MKSPTRYQPNDKPSLDSNCAPMGVILLYADGNEEIIHVNEQLLKLFECVDFDEFLAHTGGTFQGMVCSEDLESVKDSIQGQITHQDDMGHIRYRIRTKRGKLVNVIAYGRLVRREGGLRPYYNVFMTEMKQSDSVDWLTGLPSMERFCDLARMGADTILARGDNPVIIAFDLMGLKGYNAKYGRDKGDLLIRMFADCLRKHFGSEGCSRFSEDHFYAFSDDKGLSQKLEELFDDFAHYDKSVARTLPVRAGVYPCDPDDDIVAVGLDRAKMACDLDRTTWQSHASWFTSEMKYDSRLRIHVLESLERALAERWVQPYYQAVVRTVTGDICGEEALARWIDPDYGFLSPALFIPVLEEAGLLHKLDLHIIDCVAHDMIAKRENGIPIVPVSVNISLRDLRKLDIAHEISKRFDAYGLDHNLIRVELTESAASSDPELLKSQIAHLHHAGFEVWMDDFGSGYSSLNVIQEFDFDLIKLDMAFLNSNHLEKTQVIVASIVHGASRMGVATLAEGVETREQALFLESVGCDIMQGFYFTRPLSLETIMSVNEHQPREKLSETDYWNAVSLINLDDLFAADDDHGVDVVPMSEFPVGIVEYRHGTWRILRANHSYRSFLNKTGILPNSHDELKASPIVGRIDDEFILAAEHSSKSGSWERVGGRLEYGTGFQFYVRKLVSTIDARAYMVASIPTMLGSALGAFGDVPVAYAVFRVILNDAGTEVIDTEYVYANQLYYRWLGLENQSLTGRSFLEAIEGASTSWFPYCYRAAVLHEEVHDIVYSSEINHWLSFNIAPSPIEGHCVYAFTNVDREQREKEDLIIGRMTSDFIIKITDALNGEPSYEKAMNGLLETLSHVVNAERLYVIERGEALSYSTFEWCAQGVKPQIDTLQDLDNSEFDTWDQILASEPVVVIPCVEELRYVDEHLHWQLDRQGITHLLAVPFYSEGRLIGYLGADNYALDEGYDIMRLLRTISPFISARIANHRLLTELEHLNTHDPLTNMLNRHGIDMAIDKHFEEHPGQPFALALMDIDNFKDINNRHGHDVGDEILKEMASILEESFPEGTTVGRNSGDEFLAMLWGKDASSAKELFDRLSRRKKSCVCAGKRYEFSLSVGYVCCPEDASDLRSVYTFADRALYWVKRSGKADCRRYSTEMDE